MAPLDLPNVPFSEPILPPQPPSSPPSIASDGRRTRKPPTVTPRSFRRFFTPRSLLPTADNSTTPTTSRQALRALTSPAVNRLGPAFSRTSKAGTRSPHDGLPEDFIRTPSRKRKNSFSSVASPPQSSPLKRVRVRSPTSELDHDIRIPDPDFRLRPAEAPMPKQPPPVAPVRRSQALATSGALFMRSVLGPQRNKVTLRANSGVGKCCAQCINILLPLTLHRMARSHLRILFTTGRPPRLFKLFIGGGTCSSVLQCFMQ